MTTPQNNQPENRRMFEREILENDIEVRKDFSHHLEDEISNFIDSITVAYEKWVQFDSNFSSKNKQNSGMVEFLYKAINDLTISMKLLISGYVSPSGNMVRQSIESFSTAILFSNKELCFWKLFEKKKFPHHRAIHYVLKYSKELKTNEATIKELKRHVGVYNDYSHSSLLCLSSYMLRTEKEYVPYIGGFFDKSRINEYKREIDVRIHLSNLLTNIIEGISLNRDNNHPK